MEAIKAKVIDASAKIVGEMELPLDIYGVYPKEGILHEIVRWQMARWRAGTACTKTRGEVRGGGRKPWPQKHTGRARQGSIRAPQWVGGGVVHGPKPRSYEFKLNKKVRRLGLKMALSSRALTNKLFVAEGFPVVEKPKTKLLKSYLDTLGINEALIIVPERNLVLEKSASNLPKVKVLAVEGLNVYDILNHENLIISKEALDKIEERLRR
ncbi:MULTISPECIES: 50S ribosomal protein L4 [Thermodesulfobacterium]|jgi:large subunit ribosomal protein L4|uniref:Large ribosomal subunit protein uL4 n=2 Tax=Thermodesulfobacterium commune TaxID=1741 RepID=A0A075WZV5_9BACT|nr:MULTISPECIES: 50S ribosomal protein L4 [Thermodesulfobacterium]KUJ98148.1 MAG: 50S ribosomal protein L4 [Thermodesulfobacterium sp. 37_54]KUK19794.1 MAG: 50S ribosomal protein L4 [Thermodesulfobacterium commune]AIH04237.1 50S ribosomal protein L4 [Thermodesulfobacterium commune DSM 2178]KUK37865.1 MAG: 50S ribosomal protein L4 [Thermodesulfobacterium commune]MBZ4682229.1 ribosomal protein [Thermodesulfobacterium sp.]